MISKIQTTADILCIEDNPAFVQMLHYWLPGRVHAVGSLREGFQALRGKRWVSIILDLSLPDSTSDETISLIPHLKLAAHDARIVVITGCSVDREKVMMGGASALIEKSEPHCGDKLMAQL